MKICKKCGEPFEGRECKPCHLKRAKEWFDDNPDKKKEANKKAYKKRQVIK
jgi:RNA polymerase subunit RPABC4/transcription elongation factor Spt4